MVQEEYLANMAWYNSSWNYRVKITIDNTQVSADLTDFPVYVDLSDLPAGFHTNVNSDGGDIRVTKSDGTTEVPREVVSYNAGADTGELHFKADGTLSSSTDTEFYIYYGNSGASDYATSATYGAENVWTNNFVGVYHFHNIFGNIIDLPEQQIGIENIQGSYYSGSYGLVFTTTGDITITTADIDANSAGSVTFVLYKFQDGTENPSDGTLVDSVNLNVNAGVNNIVLNLNTAGTGAYWIGRTDSFSLLRGGSPTFPYDSSPTGVSFIGGREFSSSATANNWYYLYNLHIEGEVLYVDKAKDSTGVNDGEVLNITESSVGKIGESLAFPSESYSVNIADSTSFDFPNSSYTLTAWVKPSEFSSETAIIDTGNEGQNPMRLFMPSNSGEFKIQNAGDFDLTGVSSGNVFTIDAWSKIAAVVNDTTATLYHNGSQVATGAIDSYISGGNDVAIGNHPESSGSRIKSFKGAIDEVRISSGLRSSDWESAEYINQNSPSTFYIVEVQEVNGEQEVAIKNPFFFGGGL